MQVDDGAQTVPLDQQVPGSDVAMEPLGWAVPRRAPPLVSVAALIVPSRRGALPSRPALVRYPSRTVALQEPASEFPTRPITWHSANRPHASLPSPARAAPQTYLRPAEHGNAAPRAGDFLTHVSARTPAQYSTALTALRGLEATAELGLGQHYHPGSCSRGRRFRIAPSSISG
jgi:hypothetical protein